jgi:hypothetical protein
LFNIEFAVIFKYGLAVEQEMDKDVALVNKSSARVVFPMPLFVTV